MMFPLGRNQMGSAVNTASSGLPSALPSAFLSVLVLAGMELIFFIVASMRLCFAFVLKTVLIMQGCFSYC